MTQIPRALPVPRARPVAPVAAPTELVVVLAGALLLAGLSLLVTDTMRFDPKGWLRWGREIGLAESPFSTDTYPSWKPLPLVVTLPLAYTGPAAPWLWLLLVRAAGLVSLALVWRLAARRAGAAGGAVAAGLLALSPAWWTSVLGGAIEPVIVLLALAAIAAHERGRPAVAFALLVAMALGRQEALALLVVYGVVAGPPFRRAALVAAALVVAAWLGGDWLGSGDPLHGGELARAADPETPVSRFTPAVWAIAAVLAPFIVVLVARALRGTDRVIRAIAAAAVCWLAADLALLALGLPVPARFVLPACAALAVVAGTGVRASRAWTPRTT